MKIAISATGENWVSVIDGEFATCDFFQIFDTDTNRIKILENKGKKLNNNKERAVAIQIIHEKVDAIITGNITPNTFEFLKKSGVKVYKCNIVAVFKAIEMLQKNQILEMSTLDAEHQKIERNRGMLIDSFSCEGCKVCKLICPQNSIS